MFFRHLQDEVLPVLRQRADFDTLIWQQDGSMVHRAGIVKDFLAEEFGNNRIWSLDFPIEWPPRSPDLTPMDFCINNEVKGTYFYES